MKKRFKQAGVLMFVFFATVSCVMTGMGKGPLGKEVEDQYGIYTSTLQGKDVKLLLSDSSREINHARVSPDGKKVTFTRYNKKNLKGYAEEVNGYEKTEIMLMNIDGSGLETLVPAKKGIAAANGYWTEDGKGIVYVSTDNPMRKSQINMIDVESRKIRSVPIPEGVWAADPHQVGDKLVFSGAKPGAHKGIWTMNLDGSDARPITTPHFKELKRKCKPERGDYDPKFSPDNSKVALMRHVSQDNWHVIVVDVKSGKETDLSASVAVDGVPEWSSDGKLLLFYHVDTKNLPNTGLYTMKPDGSDRKKIDLPKGYFYTMPAFFPRGGSGPDARIIFSGKKVPFL